MSCAHPTRYVQRSTTCGGAWLGADYGMSRRHSMGSDPVQATSVHRPAADVETQSMVSPPVVAGRPVFQEVKVAASELPSRSDHTNVPSAKASPRPNQAAGRVPRIDDTAVFSAAVNTHAGSAFSATHAAAPSDCDVARLIRNQQVEPDKRRASPTEHSRVQVAEHQSPLRTLPSSHASPVCSTPSPHAARKQRLEQASVSVRLPSSQASPV